MRLPTFLLAVASLCLSQAAPAASFRAMPLEEIVAHSQSVVHCRVLNIESAYKNTPRGERIFTRYLLQISESWLNDNGSTRLQSLWVQGGKLGNVEQRVHGYPQLQLGQSYVLFIENLQSGLPLTGGSQGVFVELRSKNGQTELAPLTAPQQRIGLQTLKARVQAAKAMQR